MRRALALAAAVVLTGTGCAKQVPQGEDPLVALQEKFVAETADVNVVPVPAWVLHGSCGYASVEAPYNVVLVATDIGCDEHYTELHERAHEWSFRHGFWVWKDGDVCRVVPTPYCPPAERAAEAVLRAVGVPRLPNTDSDPNYSYERGYSASDPADIEAARTVLWNA